MIELSNLNGDWGLGIGDWGPNPPIPNPQSPSPSPIKKTLSLKYKIKIYLIILMSTIDKKTPFKILNAFKSQNIKNHITMSKMDKDDVTELQDSSAGIKYKL